MATRLEQDTAVARDLIQSAGDCASDEIVMARFLTWDRRHAVAAILNEYAYLGADVRKIRLSVYH
jgi:hypothetical protein